MSDQGNINLEITNPVPRFDFAIIGGGIVGLATAWQLTQLNPSLKLAVLEKEPRLAFHQTGRNSGVIHSGIYYKPGSLRAKNCRDGKAALEAFCDTYGVPWQRTGKVIVATHPQQLPQLQTIFERGKQNGVDCSVIGVDRLQQLEPHCAGTSDGDLEASQVINCGGLHSDRIARQSGLKMRERIIPFRGEYFEIKPEAHHLCKTLIYPVPDPRFPFLGVHFTRMIQGGVECGPNAVLALAREGYNWRTINLRDVFESLTYPGFTKLVARNWKTGIGEVWRSISKAAFVKALQQLVPEIRGEHLQSAPAGVRAQALGLDGKLLDDFVILRHNRVINVCNAPSPAATASLNIGHHIAELAIA